MIMDRRKAPPFVSKGQAARRDATLAATPLFVAKINDHEVWQRGPTTIRVPAVKDDYPSEIKEVLIARRTAALAGECPCGARRVYNLGHQPPMRHAPQCKASNETLEAVARAARYGFAAGPRSA